jgi:hypothetical protein
MEGAMDFGEVHLPKEHPKTSLDYVPNGNLSHSIEKFHVIFIARIFKPNPRSFGHRPIKP